MTVMHCRCAGLDVHQKTIAVCVLLGEAGCTPQREKGTFQTTTAELLRMADWLREREVTHAAMESSGVYWKPVWAVLEGQFELLLANAAHIKNVPGRKTDMKDAEWIAELLRHGLIAGSFVPPLPIQDLRELTRYRAQATGERSAVANRIRKLLEGANIKLGSVASDVMGVSGQRMLDAIVAGQTDADRLAGMARGKLRLKRDSLRAALEGRVRDHHRAMLRLLLANWRFLDQLIKELEGEIESRLEPFRQAVDLLQTIPGINALTAWNVVAEIGTDMTRFATAAHISSWAGLCPGNNESAGKHYSGTTRGGNVWLKRALCQAAWAASRTRNSYYAALFRRLAAKRGRKRAIIAVAHSLLVTIYMLLKGNQTYQELGSDYFEKLNADQFKRYLVRKLEAQGYQVTLQPQAA